MRVGACRAFVVVLAIPGVTALAQSARSSDLEGAGVVRHVIVGVAATPCVAFYLAASAH